MKIYQIIEASDCLKKISKNEMLPTRIAYKLYTMINALSLEVSFFEEKRYALFEKYGRESDSSLVVPEENKEAFLRDLEELKNINCSKNVEKVDISLDIDLGVSPADIALLEPFINFID